MFIMVITRTTCFNDSVATEIQTLNYPLYSTAPRLTSSVKTDHNLVYSVNAREKYMVVIADTNLSL